MYTPSPETSPKIRPQSTGPAAVDPASQVAPEASRVRFSTSPEPQRGGTSPVVSVPLIVPRYQRKTRQPAEMTLSDTAKSAVAAVTPTELLRQRSVEALTIRSGGSRYGDHVNYHAYAMYRFGSNRVHTHSVGYSSDGDLVLNKEEISSECESDPTRLQRRTVSVTQAVCLDPYARRALTDDEMTTRIKVNPSRLKKFPGVKAPKNKKIRNRLMNDHFANELGRQIYHKAQEEAGKRPAVEETASPPTFPQTECVTKLIHKCSDQTDALLAKKGISPILRGQRPEQHPDSAEFRFQQLSARLKDELRHAIKSDILTKVIGDLEAQMTAYILSDDFRSSAPPPLVLVLYDSYNRLLCHGVAAYYKLNSRSEDFDGAEAGQKRTLVTPPAKAERVELPHQTLLSFLQRKPALEPFSLDGPMMPLEMPPADCDSSEPPSGLTKTERKKLKKLAKLDRPPVPEDIEATAKVPAAPHSRQPRRSGRHSRTSARASESPVDSEDEPDRKPSPQLPDSPVPFAPGAT